MIIAASRSFKCFLSKIGIDCKLMLDQVFNFYKVYTIIDEIFLACELREMSQIKFLKHLLMLIGLDETQ